MTLQLYVDTFSFLEDSLLSIGTIADQRTEKEKKMWGKKNKVSESRRSFRTVLIPEYTQ